jgi:hypothetical protein
MRLRRESRNTFSHTGQKYSHFIPSRIRFCDTLSIPATHKLILNIKTYIHIYCISIQICLAVFIRFLAYYHHVSSALMSHVPQLISTYTVSYKCRIHNNLDRLCGLMVTVLGYRSGGPDSIPGTTRIKKSSGVWNEVHSASWVQLRSYLIEK